MRMIHHGVSHNVGHLVVAAVVHLLHRVQNTSLHGLQSVVYMRHGTLQYHVRGIVQEPVLIHAREVVHGRGVEAVYGLIVAVLVVLQVVLCGILLQPVLLVHLCWVFCLIVVHL